MCVPSRFDTGAGARFSIRIRRIRIVVGGAEGIPSWMNAAPEMAAIAATQPLGARFDSLRRPASKRADSAAAFSTSTPLSLNPLPHRRHHHHSLRYCSAVPFLFFFGWLRNRNEIGRKNGAAAPPSFHINASASYSALIAFFFAERSANRTRERASMEHDRNYATFQ